MKHTEIGSVGEQIVKKHLKRKGFVFLTQNYRKKWGEIDLIMRKGSVVHFVEVKTVSYETKTQDVSRETLKHEVSYPIAAESAWASETWRPEDHVDTRKLKKLLNTIQTWLSENESLHEGEWQLDVAAVKLDVGNKKGKIRLIEDVILE